MGRLGEFGRLRIRFEAEARIAELVIKERSYEVDLASTRESENLHLFAAKRRVRDHRDITLDFENYINKKLDSEGQYHFSLTVKDKEGQSANASTLGHRQRGRRLLSKSWKKNKTESTVVYSPFDASDRAPLLVHRTLELRGGPSRLRTSP